MTTVHHGVRRVDKATTVVDSSVVYNGTIEVSQINIAVRIRVSAANVMTIDALAKTDAPRATRVNTALTSIIAVDHRLGVHVSLRATRRRPGLLGL